MEVAEKNVRTLQGTGAMSRDANKVGQAVLEESVDMVTFIRLDHRQANPKTPFTWTGN